MVLNLLKYPAEKDLPFRQNADPATFPPLSLGGSQEPREKYLVCISKYCWICCIIVHLYKPTASWSYMAPALVLILILIYIGI